MLKQESQARVGEKEEEEEVMGIFLVEQWEQAGAVQNLQGWRLEWGGWVGGWVGGLGRGGEGVSMD